MEKINNDLWYNRFYKHQKQINHPISKYSIDKYIDICDKPNRFNQKYQDYFINTGMSKDEYTEFINKLAYLKKDEKLGGLMEIDGGLAGFIPPPMGSAEFVVYASKTPIEGKFKFFPEKKINLKQYFDHYGSIIMAMTSGNIPDSSHYWNRGIHRMPKSFIDQNYKGISMDMHRFTAKVAKNYSKKEYLMVHALESMSTALKKEKQLKEGKHYWVEPNIPKALDRDPPYITGGVDKHTVIQIDALLKGKRKYKT